MVQKAETAVAVLLVVALVLMIAQLTIAGSPQLTVKYNQTVNRFLHWLLRLLVLPEPRITPATMRGSLLPGYASDKGYYQKHKIRLRMTPKYGSRGWLIQVILFQKVNPPCAPLS